MPIVERLSARRILSNDSWFLIREIAFWDTSTILLYLPFHSRYPARVSRYSGLLESSFIASSIAFSASSNLSWENKVLPSRTHASANFLLIILDSFSTIWRYSLIFARASSLFPFSSACSASANTRLAVALKLPSLLSFSNSSLSFSRSCSAFSRMIVYLKWILLLRIH